MKDGLIWLTHGKKNNRRLIIQPDLDIGYTEDYWDGEQPGYSSGL